MSVIEQINFQFMFPVHFMDCWSLYILDTDKKIVMVLDPSETDPTDEMKRKQWALARKFQRRFCHVYNDMFGAGLSRRLDVCVPLGYPQYAYLLPLRLPPSL